jgi:hypothetical protein
MLDFISTIDQLEAETVELSITLNTTTSEQGNECSERCAELNVWLARSSKMLADANWWKDIAIKYYTEEVHNSPYSDLATSIQNKYIDSCCKRENYLVNIIERLNAACTHQQQSMITFISKAKVELQVNSYANSVQNT